MRTTWTEILVLVVAAALLTICTLCLVLEDTYAAGYMDASLGLFTNSRPTLSNVKFGQLGYRGYFGNGFFNQVEGGGWLQLDEGDGRKSSGYMADQIGLEVENQLLIRIALGPSYITTPDSYLGGHFQFTEDLFLGLQGNTGNTIGFKYKHFSSAGLETPNKGRDFGGLEISFPF